MFFMMAVLLDPDLLPIILAANPDVRTLHQSAVVCSVWRAAAAVSKHSLRVLGGYTACVRGRDPRLASTGFYFHRHVAAAPDGVVCVGDLNNRRFRLIRPEDGGFIEDNLPPFHLSPRGVAIHAGEFILLGCTNRGRWFAQSFRRQHTLSGSSWRGTRLALADSNGDDLHLAEGISVLEQTLFVAESGADRVHAFNLGIDFQLYTEDDFYLDVGAEFVAVCRPRFSLDDFNRPTGLAAQGTSLFVVDTGNSRLQVFKLDGQAAPEGAASRHIFSGATFERNIGRAGNAPGCFSEPRGCALLREELLVVSEARRIQVLDLHGTPIQVVAPPHARHSGLWGLTVCSDNRRVCVMSTVRNEMHTLEVLPCPRDREAQSQSQTEKTDSLPHV